MAVADRVRLQVDRETSRARARVRTALWPAAQASVGAALAWYIAHDLLSHAQPFFAPIAALIAVGTSPVQRSHRSVQMVAGVLLGIGVGEALARLLGVNAVTIGVVAFITLAAALALGAGVFGQGMMFVNQAGASAVLVVALHHTGTGGERLLDAVVGGAVAIVIGVLLFPVEPLKLIRTAERDVLASLAPALADLSAMVEREERPPAEWLTATSRSVNRAVGTLAQARRDALTATYVAPRRWRKRDAVRRERSRTHTVDLLASTSLSLVRVAVDALEHGEVLAPDVRAGIERFARTLGELAAASQPWPSRVADEAADTIAAIEPHAVSRSPLVASLTREAEGDVLLLVTPRA